MTHTGKEFVKNYNEHVDNNKYEFVSTYQDVTRCIQALHKDVTIYISKLEIEERYEECKVFLEFQNACSDFVLGYLADKDLLDFPEAVYKYLQLTGSSHPLVADPRGMVQIGPLTWTVPDSEIIRLQELFFKPASMRKKK